MVDQLWNTLVDMSGTVLLNFTSDPYLNAEVYTSVTNTCVEQICSSLVMYPARTA